MNVAFKEPKPALHALDAIAETLLLPSGIDGVYARTGAFENVVDAVAALISRHREPGAEVLRFPPVMSRRLLETSGHLKSFPHFLGFVCCLDGNETAVASAVERFEWAETGRRICRPAISRSRRRPAIRSIRRWRAAARFRPKA
jgi:hypothetical protein